MALFPSYFDCKHGVRQGENLSPILFPLFLNDMQSYIESNGGLGIELTDDQNIVWLKLLILLYADDTVILSDNAKDFQTSLNAFHNYCLEWKRNVNTSKTKIVVFGARNFNMCSGSQYLITLEILAQIAVLNDHRIRMCVSTMLNPRTCLKQPAVAIT